MKAIRRHRTWVWAGGLAAATIQLLISAHMDGWWSDVLINTGTATLLFLPFWEIGRSLDDKLHRVQDDSVARTHALGTRLEEVREEVARNIQELRNSVESTLAAEEAATLATFEDLATSPSRIQLVQALELGTAQSLLSVHGVRVHAVDEALQVYVRFTSISPLIMALELPDGARIDEIAWPESEAIESFALRFSRLLVEHNLRPAVGSYDPLIFFAELGSLLGRAYRLRLKRALMDAVRGVEQFVAPQWLITDVGLVTATNPAYTISQRRLGEADWYSHLSEKTWIDIESFGEALDTARQLRDRRAHHSPDELLREAGNS